MEDVQSRSDDRNVPLQHVGIRNLKYPLTVLDRANGRQQTVATIQLTADLPDHFKGTHMSRFLEVFNLHHQDLSMPNFLEMLQEIREALHAETAHARISFPYFIEKAAPVSLQKSYLNYECTYSGMVNSHSRRFFVGIRVPVSTVCPCSKEISDRGAHNQRGSVTVELEVKRFFWIEDIIDLVETSASCGIYTLLKREDERFITEHAYDNPRFVEDLVREVFVKLRDRGDFAWFTVSAENDESIHDHNAFAYAESGPRPVGAPAPGNYEMLS